MGHFDDRQPRSKARKATSYNKLLFANQFRTQSFVEESMMGFWQKVDTESLNIPRRKEVRGVFVNVFFGPDDMPAWISSDFDKSQNKIRVSFQYESPEESTKRIWYDGQTQLLAGEHSDKLYQIELDASEIESQKGLAPVGMVLEKISASAPSGLHRRDNYLAALNAFKQVRPQLERSLR